MAEIEMITKQTTYLKQLFHLTLSLLLACSAALRAAEGKPPSLQAASAEPLYTQEGTDLAFAAVLVNGGIKPGERFSQGPVLGSRIDGHTPTQTPLQKSFGP